MPAAKGKDTEPSRVVIVGNIPYHSVWHDATEDQLREFFSSCGQVRPVLSPSETSERTVTRLFAPRVSGNVPNSV